MIHVDVVGIIGTDIVTGTGTVEGKRGWMIVHHGDKEFIARVSWYLILYGCVQFNLQLQQLY